MERVLIAPETAEPADTEAIVERARRRGFRSFVLRPTAPYRGREGEELLRRVDDRLVISSPGPAELPVVQVTDATGLADVLARVPDGGTLVLEWAGDRVIPLENAVAQRGKRFSLWTIARGPTEVPAALGALEHGADRVIVTVRSADEVDRLEAVLERTALPTLAWKRVPLHSVRPAGLGDRVLVDTTSLLRPEEGLLVGSAAALLLLVASEAVGSTFSRPRRFRVNAGAAHSYVLMADGSTRYLSELETGDAVLVAVPGAGARAVRVGRIKIERRPMVALTVRDGARTHSLFLQEAETVRVSTDQGRLAVTGLAPGPELDAVELPSARHLGAAVEETIEER